MTQDYCKEKNDRIGLTFNTLGQTGGGSNMLIRRGVEVSLTRRDDFRDQDSLTKNLIHWKKFYQPSWKPNFQIK